MDIYAIFGNPVDHSISPRLHNIAFYDLNIDAVYTRVCLNDGSKLIETFKSLNLCGANITVPHKEIALLQCDELDKIAKAIGSVNTIIKRSNKIIGYNTDAPGFLLSIKSFENLKKVLIIGAGGTAKAISYILKTKNIQVDIVNRSKEKLAKFSDFNCFTWDDFKISKYDLVINTTSAGLKEDILPVPKELLEPTIKQSRYAYDVIYNKQTPFLNLCKKNEITHKDGLDMLLYQAVLAFNIFNDGKLNNEKVEKSMRKVLN